MTYYLRLFVILSICWVCCLSLASSISSSANAIWKHSQNWWREWLPHSIHVGTWSFSYSLVGWDICVGVASRACVGCTCVSHQHSCLLGFLLFRRTLMITDPCNLSEGLRARHGSSAMVQFFLLRIRERQAPKFSILWSACTCLHEGRSWNPILFLNWGLEKILVEATPVRSQCLQL